MWALVPSEHKAFEPTLLSASNGTSEKDGITCIIWVLLILAAVVIERLTAVKEAVEDVLLMYFGAMCPTFSK